MVLPSRMTVTVSATFLISLSLWLMMIDALLLEVQDQVEQVVGVLVVQCGGRLVEDEELHALREGLRDLDELLLADADLEDLGRRVLPQADPGEQCCRLLVGAVPVDEAERPLQLVVEEDVLRDGEVGAEGQLLVDDDDALGLRVADVLELHRLALEDDVALVGAERVDAGQHLHERRLAGAVLTADGVHGTALHIERDVREGLDAGEGLDDVAHLEDARGLA